MTSPSLLAIYDENTDVEYVTTDEVEIHELSDFSYRNDSSVTIGYSVTEDLERFADAPDEIRGAAYGAMQRWIGERTDLLSAHYPDLVEDYQVAVHAAIAAWTAETSPEAVTAWIAAA